MHPLHFHPEGGTTCGPLIKFKKGGFVAELPIKPYAFKYRAPFVSPINGIIEIGLLHDYMSIISGC